MTSKSSVLSKLLLAILFSALPLLAPIAVNAQQQPTELDQIKKDVESLQKLVREIEGRLYVLQQRLARLPKVGPTPIDRNANLLKLIFNELSTLRKDGSLKDVKINVTVTDNGVIVLKGQVATAEQMTKVLATVRKVSGVNSIVNQMTVGKPKDPKTSTTMFFDGNDAAEVSPYFVHQR